MRGETSTTVKYTILLLLLPGLVSGESAPSSLFLVDLKAPRAYTALSSQ